jgi:hypothetical protein
MTNPKGVYLVEEIELNWMERKLRNKKISEETRTMPSIHKNIKAVISCHSLIVKLDYPDNPTFCEKYENPEHGELPIGTGIGKTTKTVNCLVRGGEKNVILVCPTDALAFSAYGHHNPNTG